MALDETQEQIARLVEVAQRVVEQDDEAAHE